MTLILIILKNKIYHNTFWTETWANHLSKGYFGTNWLGGPSYPTQNISKFNLIRLLMVR